MSCTVIMLSNHSGHTLLAALKSVLRQQGLQEIILVDTGTPLDMLARLQQMTLTEPRIKIVTGAEKASFAHACNLGVSEAKGEFLVFMNPDCLMPPEALKTIASELIKDSQAVLAGGVILNPDMSIRETGRILPITPQIVLSEAIKLKSSAKLTAFADDAAKPYEVELVPSAFMCIRRADYVKLGGMDEAYAFGARLDFCRRIRVNNGKIICVPAVQIACMQDAYMGNRTSREEWDRGRGYMRYFRRHYSDDSVPGFLLLLDICLTLRFILRVSFRKFKALSTPKPMMKHSIAAKRLMVLASGLAELAEKKDWYGRTVLVTGATSQVGLCVVKRLIAQGAAVLAVSRGEPIPYQHEYLRWIKGDLTDAGLSLQGYMVDMVVHCAPLWTLPPAIEKLAEAEAKRIIAFGTTSVFGKALSHNAYEKNVVIKLVAAERTLAELCDEKNIAWTIFRPTLTYGVGLDVNVTSIAKIIDRYNQFAVYPPAFGRRQPVHADDLAIAVIQAADVSITHGKSYNLSGGEVLTYYQMLERIFSVCKKPVKIIKTTMLPFLLTLAGLVTRRKHINGEVAHRMNDDLMFFNDDATKDFAYSPRSFLSGGIKDIEGF
jgi:GT2 family glycosyltransferase/nucleoside-diphosphate-sugar epimerase